MNTILKYGDHGARVEHLQHLLTASRFRDFKPGPIDGQFGPRTASACQRAKFVLGYRRQDLTPVGGSALFGYLSGTRPLSAAMKERRTIRLAEEAKAEAAESAPTAMRLRAADIIHGELGETERGGNSNSIKYNDWWGWGAVAYCAIGVAWSWVKAGSKAFVKGIHWAGTDLMLEDAKNHRYGLRLTSDPRRGCPGVIDFDGHADPDHCITYWEDMGNGMCKTIEFNHMGPSGREGVFYGERPLRNCWFFEVLK